MKLQTILGLFLFCISLGTFAQTVGVTIKKGGIEEGYTLFTPHQGTNTYLINNCGEVVNQWTSTYKPGNTVYLDADGNLIRTGRYPSDEFPGRPRGDGGIVEKYNWEGDLIWDFEYRSGGVLAHHDALPLPNGNILILAWDQHSFEESVQAGRDPEEIPSGDIWSEHLIEVDPSRPAGEEIVWEWYLWDHLVQDYDPEKDNYGDPAEHPELVDINYVEYTSINDWIHANGIDYNPQLDQVMISARNFRELWVIDHSTSTSEASGSTGGNSGKGGDLLYRWGNPSAYRQGTLEEMIFHDQHNTRWIADGKPHGGKIMVFNNGAGRPEGAYSSIDVIDPPLMEDGNYAFESGRFLPASLDWSYVAPVPTSFYSSFLSGAQMMNNGNILICEGANGCFYETTIEGEKLWEYINPDSERGILTQGDSRLDDTGRNDNLMFRAEKYSPDFEGFAGKVLTPSLQIEHDPLPCNVVTFAEDHISRDQLTIFPNPSHDESYIFTGSKKPVDIRIINVMTLQEYEFDNVINGDVLDTSNLPKGIYIIKAGEQQAKLVVY